MIPHKLHINNFLSYGETQIIDFSPYHFICLSGKNGHGKSALLDALTWALWGNARKTAGSSKADQGLLRLGQTRMMVIFDFELNTTLYRIRREFSQTQGKAYATLEFGMINTETQAIIPLTDKTIRDTQAKIEEVLRLDFDSFINSAFLRQGQSNEFSQKSPKDRKEILAKILGLTQYEIIRKRALEQSRQASIEQNALQAMLININQELQNNNNITDSLHALEEQLAQCVLGMFSTEECYRQLDINYNQLFAQQQHLTSLCTTLQQQEALYYQQKAEFITLVHAWRLARKRIRQLPDQTTLLDKKMQLMLALQHHQELLQKSLEQKERLLLLNKNIQNVEQEHTNKQSKLLDQEKLAHERLRIEYAQVANQEKELFKRLQQLEHEAKEACNINMQLQQHIQSLVNNADVLVQSDQQFEKRKQVYQRLSTQGNIFAQQLQQLQQKNNLVHNEQDPSCPLCEQNLSATRRRFLKQKFAQEQHWLMHRINRVSYILPQLKSALIEQHTYLDALKKKQEEHNRSVLQSQEYVKQAVAMRKTYEENQILLNNNKQQQETIIAALKAQDTALQELQTCNMQLLHNLPEYRALQQQIQELNQALETTIYNGDEHKKIHQALHIIEEQIIIYNHLQQEQRVQEQRTAHIERQRQELKQIKQNCNELCSTIKEKQKLDEQIDVINKQKQTQKSTLAELQIRKEALLQEKGTLQAKQAAYIQLKEQCKKQEDNIKTLQETIDDYNSIALATSKDGIQALLIEEAIPEIEQEANYLLAKLTNNQSQLFIESLRDLKKGGTKETLDIKISDPMGIRPYELFSGGEAFRIDFALRIAISKLLARRAGTALQTLIIDEGFGSQDEEGLSHIMDALYKIQDDFSKIIIVSHLPSMKDQFPVHFFIEKTPSGSCVQVIEHE